MTKTDKIFAEALLRAAVVSNCEREMDALEADTTEIHFSERHEERMRHLFARERAKGRVAKIWVVAYKTIIAATILVTLLSSTLMLNTSVRAAVTGAIATWYEKFTSFTSSTDNMDATYVEWTFGYVPDGFAEQSAAFVEGYTTLIYANVDGATLNLSVFPSGTGSVGIDNEQSQHSIVYNDGVEYQIFRANDDSYPSNIIWERYGYDFFVSSEVDPDILLGIAFSVQKK